MRYFLFKLSGENDRKDGNYWSIYEYANANYTNKIDVVYLVKEIFCIVPSNTHIIGNAFYIAVYGDLKINNDIAFIE